MRCAECGASYGDAGDSCAARFDALLALDHSRQEPWGSRHGLAFAAYALQHPQLHARSLDNAWAALVRIYAGGERAERVFATLRAAGGQRPAHWRGAGDTPRRPPQPVRAPPTTIADLGDFDASTYAARLDDWCRGALAMWGLDVPATSSPPAA